ncbi:MULTISPECIES: hypothetical protein [unclassified Curtobacterium]|uniref:hypothetical protein n=1 Tax=unclassified Curtobacterium TaxID=257496 RepID=UPI0008DDF008|nr:MULTISPECIES: hypothetical protein [unclassified Curtobacterium]
MQKIVGMAAGVGLVLSSITLGSVTANAEQADGPTVSGTVHRQDGTAFRAGTPVALFATEREDEAGPSPVGASSSATPVASGTVGASGSFSLTVSDVQAVRGAADPGGVVDLEVRAVDGSEYAPFAMSRKVVERGDTIELRDPSTDAASARSAVEHPEPVSMTATSTVSSPADVGMAVLPSTSRAASDQPTPFTQICGETKTKNLGQRRVLVGATYGVAPYTNGRFTYKNGATSNLGVVFSANAKKGSWSKAGTSSRSSTSTIDYGARYGGTAYYTYFTYGQYAQWCRPLGSSQNRVYNHVVRATGYAGGSQVASAPVPAASRCTPFANGTTITTDTTAANTWEQAVNFLGPLGVTLTAKTGWSASASMSYLNKSGSTKRICGTKGNWGAAPERAVTK